MDDARLGQESARVLHFLPTAQRARSHLKRIQGALDRSSSRSGGGGVEADRRGGFSRDRSGAASAFSGER